MHATWEVTHKGSEGLGLPGGAGGADTQDERQKEVMQAGQVASKQPKA